MARAKRSEASRVLEYFQAQPLELAKEILGLCQAAVKAREPGKTVKKVAKLGKVSQMGHEGAVGE